MKKSFLITLLLLILSVAGLFTAHGRIDRARDAVTLTETVLYGEAEKARGLTAHLNTTVDRRLFWNTRFSVGEPTDTATRFAFYPARRVQDFLRNFGGVYLELYTDFGMSSSGRIDLESEDLYGMGVVYRDVASRAPAGEEYREIISLSDYFENYPLFLTLDLPALWVDETGQYPAEHRHPMDRIESMSELEAFFRIPVVEGHQIEVHVTKNAAGEVNGWGMSSLEGGVNLWTQSALTDDGCYFTFNNRTADGGYVDTSLIPGGYGIYFLPFKTEVEHKVVDASGLSMVYALDPQAEVLSLLADEGGNRILLLTREEDCVLKVIDMDTMKTLQRLTLLEDIGDAWFQSIYYENDLLVPILGDNRFAVVWSREGGDFEIQFQGDFVSSDEDALLRYGTVMAFDGSRLAMAAPTLDTEYRQRNCGLYLAVYDKTGLTFMARHDSSLDAPPAADYSGRCEPVEYEPLILRFE